MYFKAVVVGAAVAGTVQAAAMPYDPESYGVLAPQPEFNPSVASALSVHQPKAYSTGSYAPVGTGSFGTNPYMPFGGNNGGGEGGTSQPAVTGIPFKPTGTATVVAVPTPFIAPGAPFSNGSMPHVPIPVNPLPSTHPGAGGATGSGSGSGTGSGTGTGTGTGSGEGSPSSTPLPVSTNGASKNSGIVGTLISAIGAAVFFI